MNRIHNHISESLPDDIEVVVFGWSNKHGRCYECGCPAAFYAGSTPVAIGRAAECEAMMRDLTNGERGCFDPKDHEIQPEQLRCAVCAANAAADGDIIHRIEPEIE